MSSDVSPARLPRAASLVTRAGLVLTVLGALSLLLSGLGSRWDWWDFRTGFVIFRFTLYGGLLVIVVVLAGLVLACLARAGNVMFVYSMNSCTTGVPGFGGAGCANPDANEAPAGATGLAAPNLQIN